MFQTTRAQPTLPRSPLLLLQLSAGVNGMFALSWGAAPGVSKKLFGFKVGGCKMARYQHGCFCHISAGAHDFPPCAATRFCVI